MRQTNRFRRSKGQLNPTKWKYIENLNSKKINGMQVTNYYSIGCWFIIMMCGNVRGFRKFKCPNWLFNDESLRTTIATQSLPSSLHMSLQMLFLVSNTATYSCSFMKHTQTGLITYVHPMSSHTRSGFIYAATNSTVAPTYIHIQLDL